MEHKPGRGEKSSVFEMLVAKLFIAAEPGSEKIQTQASSNSF